MSAPVVDLPEGWTTASALSDLHQSECTATAYDDSHPETITGEASAGTIDVHYENAHFRCVQGVSGFVRSTEGALDVLVQPTNMNPTTVAKCDCLYDITFSLEAASGTQHVNVYRRWDHKSGSDSPTLVGSITAEVP